MPNTNKGYCHCGCGRKTNIAKKSCTAKGYVKGEPMRFCHGHQKLPTTEERFWTKVKKTDGCWNWIGTKNATGYGIIGINGKNHLAHRYSYKLHIGKIPIGMSILHHCDVPACVNPAHIFIGTQADNMADMAQKGRANGGPPSGEGNDNVKLTETKVRAIFNDRENGMSFRSIGKKYSISHTQAWRILNGESWAHIWK